MENNNPVVGQPANPAGGVQPAIPDGGQAPVAPATPAPVVPPAPAPVVPAVPVEQVKKEPVVAKEQVEVSQPAPVAIPDGRQAPATQGNVSQIMLVEDDGFLSSLMKTKLEKSGMSVRLVVDGEQALETLKTFKPNLILLDLILPKKSGFEVLEAIQADPNINQIPVIILSNLGQESDVEKGKQLGAVEYYVKAKTSIDELVNKVSGFLKGGQPLA